MSLNNEYYIGGDLYKGSYEILFKDIKKIVKEKPSILKTAIDGFSERIRFKYGKKISNDELKETFEYLSFFEGTTRIKIYNISNFPGETDDDFNEFFQLLTTLKLKNRLHIKIHTTPLIPSLATPLKFSAVELFPDWNKKGYNDRYIIKNDNLIAYHSAMNTGAFTHLQEVVAIRADEDTDRLFHKICFSKNLKKANSTDKIKILKENFDIEKYLSEDFNSGWFLESYIKNNKLKDIYYERNNKTDR